MIFVLYLLACWCLGKWHVFISLNFYITYIFLTHMNHTHKPKIFCWSVSAFTGLLYGCVCLNVDNWLDWHYFKKMCGCECVLWLWQFWAIVSLFISPNCGKERKRVGQESLSYCIFFPYSSCSHFVWMQELLPNKAFNKIYFFHSSVTFILWLSLGLDQHFGLLISA